MTNPKQPDRRIHFICTNQSCLVDLYRFNRPQVIQCGICRHSWKPEIYHYSSYAYGREEPNPNAGKEFFLHMPCVKHGICGCEDCEKEKLYAE